MHRFTALKGLLNVVAGFGLDAEHATARRPVVRRHRTAGQQAAAAGAHQQQIQWPGLFKQLLGGGARRRSPADNRTVAPASGPALWRASGDFFTIFAVALIDDHVGAVAARRRQLGRRGVVGHYDGGANAQFARRQRHRLCVVAG